MCHPQSTFEEKKKNHLSCKRCKNFFFGRFFFFFFSSIWNTSVTRPLHHTPTVKTKRQHTTEPFVSTPMTDVWMQALTSRRRSWIEETSQSRSPCDGLGFTPPPPPPPLSQHPNDWGINRWLDRPWKLVSRLWHAGKTNRCLLRRLRLEETYVLDAAVWVVHSACDIISHWRLVSTALLLWYGLDSVVASWLKRKMSPRNSWKPRVCGLWRLFLLVLRNKTDYIWTRTHRLTGLSVTFNAGT